ncbi:PAB-dependent poly(A)-specific ribonuclease subunit pan3 [Endocarpon pusillum Z07020]|uniref:PAN2-PAN3 deadenylation complex subunit PAN3 n=1 Tax=Endocarpon pusillum (strain Z07020 / HMAS-L-300199) TaxID=1263415 RepID=U1FYA2_ENDPU|nr:PAB-dependent poly(A)-specific ribonuclease subunit pan3 [Endocarpon pusillum Z07020]ERF69897.1 PAB-dependent poly(A)-specific ribonuclease subunit pan3 [Endocarpon pusillum Z07020]
MKKTFNVDSPSFTPSFLSATENVNANGKKSTGISPKAANAAPFLPKSAAVSRADTSTPDWPVDVQEFIPQSYSSSHMANGSEGSAYDHFQTSSSHIPAQSSLNSQPPLYQDALSMGGAGFFPSQSGFQQPAQYHQYAPVGPHNQNLQGYQRNVHDLFIPNDFREEIQKKAAATLQTIPNLHLPAHVESYHSLVPLDTNQKSSTILGGYSSWIYKAQSSTNGKFFALRRIEGFRLTNEKAIRTVQNWKTLINSSVVGIHDAFTTRNFNDSSLLFVCDYYPMAKTLAEYHLGQSKLLRSRNNPEQVSEVVLWAYMTQIASALKAIHSRGLAARVISPSKILLTGKNRIRLNACAILDVVHYDAQVAVPHLQRQDLVNFGLLILSLGSNTPDASQNFAKAMDQFKRHYGKELQAAVVWLYSAMQNQEKTIDQFLSNISTQMVTAFDGALQLDDQLNSEFGREVENARLFRLMAKLGFINERPEYEHDRQWSENGERYYLKLFRDYIFHQVDAQENPVVDLGHVLSCLNKLDAGSDERLTLVSRDNQSCFVVSYRELKKGMESAFQELSKNARRSH